MKHIRLLKLLGACQESIDFASQYSSFEEIWANCPRGDWILRLAYKLNVDDKPLTLTKGYCARTVYHIMKDERSKDAVIAAINYGRGLITKTELNAACITADYAAADAAYAAYAAYAAAVHAAAVHAAKLISSLLKLINKFEDEN